MKGVLVDDSCLATVTALLALLVKVRRISEHVYRATLEVYFTR
jgi:hypothetical protein